MKFKSLVVSAIAALTFGIPAFADVGLNMPISLAASGAHTAASVVTADQTNKNWKGLHVIIDTTAFTSGTYTPHIQAKDPVSGKYYDLLVGAAITGTGTTVLKIYPGITATTNVAASDFLPQTWRVQMVGASTPSMTYSIGGFLEY